MSRLNRNSQRRPPSGSKGSAVPSPPKPFLLRRGEQAAAAAVTLLALVGLLVAWWMRGGHRGELLEIDRAEPDSIEFVVDINTAEWPELTLLPGVGETMAKRIVQSRQQDGPFLDLQDIQRVRGIGPKTYEKLRPYLLPLPADEAIVDDSVDFRERGA